MRFVPLAFLFALAAPLGAQTTHTVTVRNFEFDPATLVVEAGDTVRWINESGAHNVNALTGPEAFSSGAVTGGAWEYAFTFAQVGTNTYQCDAHSGSMQGSVTVAPATSGEAPATDEPEGLELAGPNPFRSSARVALRLAHPREVRVAVYDARGRQLAVLFDGLAPAGETALSWTPEGHTSGIYVFRVTGEVHSSLGIARVGTLARGH